MGAVLAHAPDRAAQMIADLLPGRRLVRPQQHRHWAPGGGAVDTDRQKTALILMSVEQRELLMAEYVKQSADPMIGRLIIRRYIGDAI